MERLVNALKGRAAALDLAAGQTRFGLVSSVDPATYTARVLFQPENVLSGWLPILSGWIGPGWGMVCPPTPGQQVLVLAQEGNAEHGVIVGTAFSNTTVPPAAPPGELWLVHASGSYLKLLGDGTIAGQASVFNLTGNVHINGSLTVTAEISDLNAAHGTLAALRSDYDVHTHIDSRGAATSAPTPQD